MKFSGPLLLAASAAIALAACTGGDPPSSSVDAATTTALAAPAARAVTAADVVALSTDGRGRPRFLRAVQPVIAPGATPGHAALAVIDALAPVWGVATPADVAIDTVRTLRGGATLVTLRQEVGGVPIWDGRLVVLLGADGALIAVSGDRRPRGDGVRDAFALDAGAATAIAVADRFGPDATRGPSQAKRALVAVGDRLVAAWVVEVYGAPATSTDTHLWRVFVDGKRGDVVRRDDLTVDVAFTYRVFADADAAGRPFDGPQTSFAPHPTGTPDGSQPAFAAPLLVTMDGFNTNPAGMLDPWLAATATTSNGNNVDAYADRAAPDGLSGTDFRASTTATRTFDRSYDVAQGPLVSQAQGMAAVIQLFYVNNWLHDWWYDSGFDEAAGNAQVDNYGRGGAGGDPIKAEAQDDAVGGSRNNANMSTPSDGLSPTMQMYLWSGASSRTLTVNPGGLSFATGTAAFGPQVFDVTAQVVRASDTAHEACGPIASATGRIVLVTRGTCSFAQKAQNVGAAGGIGMILANTAAGVENMGGTGASLPPSLMVSQADGATLAAAIAAGTTTARMQRSAAGVERDGDLDTVVVAHEWGHYLHHRLAPCGANLCAAMSEGWGDFVGLMTVLRATDDPHGTYAIGVYSGASVADAYFGIRRAPYSSNLTRSGFTFRHIAQSATLPTTFPIAFTGNNNEVHNAGEVWTAMLWQAYVALIDKDGFAIARRQMSDYIVAGLQLTPADATWTEARDAILAAVQAIDATDTVTVAQAFAQRGAGSCAVSPPSTSTSFEGVVEDFTLRGRLGVGAITLDDDIVTCDADDILDAGETGTLRVTIANGGTAALTGTTVTVSTTTPGVTIVAPSHTVPTVPALGSAVESFTVQMAPTVTAQTAIAITVQLANANACTTTATATATIRGHYDVVLNASANDDVEADATPWTRSGSAGVWNRELLGTSIGWHGLDLGAPSDARLVSPPLAIGPGNFTMGYSHRFDFEYSTGTAFDGGVVEISTNGGATWTDAEMLGATPGYTQTITTTSGNPLGGRRAYGRRNAAYPARNTASLAFGNQFAGMTILVRFRIGTDPAAGGGGWELDDLTFTGLAATPFPALAAEPGACVPPPIDAGVDAPLDAAIDAPTDAPLDAALDAAIDALTDAPDDAPTDAPDDASGDANPAEDAPPALDGAPAIDAAEPGDPVDSGCCSTGRRGAPGSIALALAAFALVLRRRRR